MKKLFLFSLLLLLALSVFADIYPIGTLGSSSSATYGPISGLYDYGWTKTIITAAEMNTAGYDGTDNIVGLGYYVGNTPSNYQIIDVHCFVRHTTLGTYTTTADETGTAMPDSTAFTQVFSGTLSFNGGGWHYFAFNMANFDWDGASNIEVFWKNWDGDYVTGYPTYRYASTSPDYKVVYKQQDSTWPTTAGTRSTSRSNISIVTPSADPPNPAILGYPTDAGYAFLDATLSWSDGGGMPTSYDVYLGTVNPPTTLVADDITTTSYTPTLAPGTTYYWKVVPSNANGPATGVSTWSFKTPTANQIAESFDATDFPPVGWTTPGGAFTRSTSTPYYGAASAYESIAAGPSYLYTPMLELTSTSELNWWMRTSTTTGIGRVQIVYSEDGTNWNDIGDEISMPTETTWMNYNVDLSSLDGDNYFIGFKVFSSTTSSSAFYIDHVFGPELAALYPEPAEVVYPTHLGWAFMDGVLSWTPAATGGLPNSYDVYFGTTNPPSFAVNQTGTTYTPTLAAGTTYYWQIVPRNDTGSAENCPVWSFSTPTATQLAESFDATDFPPLGWTTPGGAFSRSTSTPFYGAASAYEYIAAGPSYLYTPMLGLTATSELDWWMRTSTTTGIGRVQIVYSTDGTTWSNIGDEITMPTETTWMHYNVDLSSLAGNNYFIGFKVYSTTSSSCYFYIDHVFGPELAAITPGSPVLTDPADLATDVSEFPTLEWDPPTIGGIPTGYNLYLDSVNGSTLYASDVTSPYTLTTALNYNTTYYWTVVAYNGSGDGPAATPFSFTTREDPTISVLPWLEDFGTTGTTFPPTNWTRWSGLLTPEPVTLTSSTGYWLQDDFSNVVTDPTNKAAKTNIYGTTWKYWLMTPPIQMPGAGYQLEFDIALTDYNNAALPDDPAGYSGVDDRFAVLISDGSTWSQANAIKLWDNDAATTGGIYEVYNDVPHTGIHYTIPLDAYTGVKYIAFYGESTVSNADNDFFVDNVMIRQTPAGAPEHVTLVSPVDGTTGVLPESTTLSWTAAITGGTPAYYEVYVGEFPIDPTTAYYGEYFYETSNPSLNLSAQTDITLAYDSQWYWAVLPYNSEGLAPDPTAPEFMVWDFTTAPDPSIVTLPYEEYFDTVTAPALPWGWSAYINSTSTSAVVATYSSTTYAQSAPNSVRLYNPSDASADLRLITPVINSSIPVNTTKIKFYARSSSAGYPLLVGTVSAPDGSGVFTQMQQIDLTATKAEYTVSFDAYAGTDQYICFKHGLGGTGRTLYVDNVRLLEILPVDLAATGITGPNILEAGNSYDYVVSVFNEGTTTVNSYSLNLKQADGTLLTSTAITTPLDPAATAQITIPWIPATGGVYQVYGEVVAAGDGNAANDESALKSVYVLDNSMTLIPLGNDATTTSGYYLPFGFYHKNSVGEALYFPDETHLQSGTISAIAFKNTFGSTTVLNKPVKIWMAHTTVTDLTGGWLPAADYTLVFDGNVDFPAGVNYIPIPLTTPFNYTGGTLAVRFNRPMDTGFYTTSDKFYYTTTPEHTNRGRYLVNDSTVYDPMDPSAAGTAVGYLPNTTFVVQNAVMQTGAVLSGHVYETGGTTPIAGATVTLSDERYSTTTNAEGYYEFTFWEAHTVTAVASKATYYSQTVTGLNLTIGNTITQNFILGTMPRVTVSGIVNTNDVPGGIEGAAIALNGSEVYNVVSGANGLFSIPNVLGSNAGQAYTITITKDGYQGYSAAVTVLEANLDLGTITLVEHLWTAYNLVASHNAGNADLTWDAAAEPDYFLFDFEADNGGWVPSSNWTNPLGDWEWANTYPTGGTFNWTDSATNCVPPTAAHSGTGLWGTKLYTNYSMSGGWSYLTREVNLGEFANPQLRFWRWNNLYYTYDYYYVQVSTDGTNWTNVLSETTINNAWAEKVVDLSTYANQTISIRFAMYATTVVSYAGLYIDDIYIGPASSAPALAGRNQDRSFQNYSLYRLLAADEATPASWSLLSSALTDTVYTDNGFGAVPGGTYEWAVKANYSGSQSSEPIFSNTLGRVYNPADIAATTMGATVQLSWTAEPGATFYKIYAADDPYGVFTYLGYSQTATYSVALPAAKKFYKVTAVANEALPAAPVPAKDTMK